MPQIEAALKGRDFSESLETFGKLRDKVPAEWLEIWNGFRLEMYLNSRDMKEYKIEYASD
jgi:hypothetical protein